MSARKLHGGRSGDVAGAVRRLAGRWEVMPQPAIGGPAEAPVRVDLALLHPGRGIALVDLAPRSTANAVASLRQRLDAACVDLRHPGLLPVVYCCLAPDEIPQLPRLLDAAFATQRPITVSDADWTATVRTVLAAGSAQVPGAARAPEASGRWSAPARVGVVLLLPIAGAALLALGLAGPQAPPPRGAVAEAPLLTGPAAEGAWSFGDAEAPLRAGHAHDPVAALGPHATGADAPPQPATGAAEAVAPREAAGPPPPEGPMSADVPDAPEGSAFIAGAPDPGQAEDESPAGPGTGPSSLAGGSPPPDGPDPAAGQPVAEPVPSAIASGVPDTAEPPASTPIAPGFDAGPPPGREATAAQAVGPTPGSGETPPEGPPGGAAGLPDRPDGALPEEPPSAPTILSAPSLPAPGDEGPQPGQAVAVAASPPAAAAPASPLAADQAPEEDLVPSAGTGPEPATTAAAAATPQPGAAVEGDAPDLAAPAAEAALPLPPPPIFAPRPSGEPGPAARDAPPPTQPRAAATAEAAAPRQPASPRCAAILARLQLGETPSHADRLHLQTICAPRP